MRKKTTVILFIVGTACSVLGVLIYFVSFLALLPAMGNVDPSPTPNVDGLIPGFLIGLIFAVIFILAGAGLELAARIGMLIKQAKHQQWPWFVCTLLFGWLCMLIYLIVEPETPLPQPQYTAPAYIPQYQPQPEYQPYETREQSQQYETMQYREQSQLMEQRPPQD